MIFFVVVILALVAYCSFRAAIKKDEKERKDASSAFEAKEAERILRERQRQKEEEQDRETDKLTGGFTSRGYSSSSSDGCKVNTYKVMGTSFCEEAILNLAKENYEYDLSKKEIVESGNTDERIWKYFFDPCKVSLVPEPDNAEDPNAIKVLVDGEHIGYIKSGSTAHLRKLLERDGIVKIRCEIGGGPYKIVQEDYDDDVDKTTYSLEKDSVSFSVRLIITERA